LNGGILGSAFNPLTQSNVQYNAEIRVPIKGWTDQAVNVSPLIKTVYIRDEKSSGTAGGTNTTGSYQTRDLNTIDGDTSIATLSSNQFTLYPGEYEIEAEVPGYAVNSHKAQLYDITNAASVKIGSTEQSAGLYLTTINSSISAKVRIAEPTTYEIRHRTETQIVGNGYGLAASFGDNEVYTQVKITKVR
jgi:hypothetical protein